MKLDLAGYYLAGGGASGGGGPEVESLSVTENGTYSEEGKAYSPVTVNVPIPTLETKSITANGNYDAPSGKAYNRVEVNVAAVSKLPQVVDRTVTEITAADLAGATSIGNYAFYTCASFTSITIPSGVTTIGVYAFSSCANLASVTIPPTVTNIGMYAFDSCSSLASITIPSGVTWLYNSTFEGCSSLASITIPSGVTGIGHRVFYGCQGLASVTVEATTPPTLLNINAFSNTSSSLIIYVPAASVDTYKEATNWSNYSDKIQAIPS